MCYNFHVCIRQHINKYYDKIQSYSKKKKV